MRYHLDTSRWRPWRIWNRDGLRRCGWLNNVACVGTLARVLFPRNDSTASTSNMFCRMNGGSISALGFNPTNSLIHIIRVSGHGNGARSCDRAQPGGWQDLQPCRRGWLLGERIRLCMKESYDYEAMRRHVIPRRWNMPVGQAL